MSVLDKADLLVLKAHQWVVNTPYKTPKWWTIWAVNTFVLAATYLCFLKMPKWHAWVVILLITFYWLIMNVTLRYSNGWRMYLTDARARMWRTIAMVSSIPYMATALWLYEDYNDIVRFICNLTFMSTYYFPLCEDPPPPRRKTQLVPQL